MQDSSRMKKEAAESEGSIDRLSHLPRPILHRILCFLSQKEALQTCVLSKSWRDIGPTRPKLEFCADAFGFKTLPSCLFLDKTLQRYRDQKLSIEEFCFRLWVSALLADSDLISFSEKWIPVVMLDMGVKVFDFDLSSHEHWLKYQSPYINLPLAIFKSESIREFSLRGCKLYQNPTTTTTSDHRAVMLLKNLTTLSLTKVDIEDEALEKILLGCPFIVNLVLDSCKGLRTVNVSKVHNRLRFFDFCSSPFSHGCSIEIYTPTIETIKIHGFPIWFDTHNIYLFQHLKSLHLRAVRLSEVSLNNFSSNFPCLEDLSLQSCYGACKEFHLSSVSIKYLAVEFLDDNDHPDKVVIDTPSLVKFEYEGYIPQSFSLKTTASAWKSKITSHSDEYLDNLGASRWCRHLIEMLRSLKDSEISLDIYQDSQCLVEACICGGGGCEPVGVERLSLMAFDHGVSTNSAIINNLFHICRPRNMNQFLHLGPDGECEEAENRLIELLTEIFISDRKTRNYSWQHDLEEASMERGPLEAFGNEVRFRLKWRD